MKPPEDEFLTKLELIARRYVATAWIQPFPIKNITAHVCDRVAGALIDLQTVVYAQQLGTHEAPVTFTYPASWFQHLKKTLGLRYKTHQVTKTATFTTLATYPKAKLPRDTFGKPVYKVDIEVQDETRN